MSYHFFTDKEFAGPSPIDVLRIWDRVPRQLRIRPRITIPKFTFINSQGYGIAVKATIEDTIEITRFWNNYYAGPDWKFKCTTKDVERWMSQGFILVLKELINFKKEIVATFCCRLIDGGITCGSHIEVAGLIDGLVVTPRLRGQGVASYMLAAMDYTVYSNPATNKSVFFWLREHSSSVNSMLQAPICVLDYCYIKLSDTVQHYGKASKAEQKLVQQVVNYVFENSRGEFTISCRNYSDPEIYWYLVNSSLIGIVDTHRVTTDDYVLWEVVFAANLSPPFFVNLQNSIEISAAALPCTKGIVFASNSKSRGNLRYPTAPWTSGTSGCLSMHVYNWMPPTFITGDILLAHGCI
jgi:hypothetical protein